MNRKVLILANVGSRDVFYRGEEIKPAREQSEELLASFEQVSQDVQLPILLPGLKFIESLSFKYPELLERGGNAPRVGLFCTDQEDPRHRENDTVGFARIAEKKLPELFPNRSENKGLRLNQKRPVIIEVIRDNPARYDRMYRAYARFFTDNARLGASEETLCFVLASGGTPAMNAMLILHAVQHFGENCVQVYVPPGEEPVEMRVGKQIAEADARRKFDEALGGVQFRAAARIASDAFGGYREPACEYAEHRLAFDFREARDLCEKAVGMAEGGARDLLEDHAEVSGRLERGASNRSDQALLIEELFYNLEVKHESGEFVDVLGRTFRLAEALLTWVVETNTSIRTGKNAKLSKQEAAVNEVPGLRGFLQSYKSDEIGRFDFGRELNRPALMAVAEYLIEPQSGLAEEPRGQVERAVEVARSIKKLADLRNDTILAHGFEGVSEEDIVREYDSNTLVEDLRTSVSSALGRDLSTNPFFELAEKLKF